MRFLNHAAAILILASGFAFAQSSAPQDLTQTAVEPAKAEDLAAQVAALQRQLDQLEKRVDAALPAPSQAVTKPDSESSNGAPADRMAELEQKVQLLESAQTNNFTPETSAEADKRTLVSLDSKGFVVTSADKTWRFKVGGYVQGDGKTFIDDKTTLHGITNTVYPEFDNNNLRRARLILSGSYSRFLDFYVAPEFSGYGSSLAGTSVNGLNGGAPAFSPSLYDAYADIKFAPFLIMRGGKFKSPFGLEQLQSATDMTFIVRSLATDLVPNRDVGFMLWGNVRDHFMYQVATLNGSVDLNGSKGDGSAHDGRTLMARVFGVPFAKHGPEALSGLGIGLAVSTGHQDPVSYKGTIIAAGLPSFKTPGGEATFFQYIGGATTTVTSSSCSSTSPCTVATAMKANSAVALGNEIRFSPQAYYYYGPFGLMAEYVRDGEHIANLASVSSSGPTYNAVREIDNHAWQVSGSWVITGEKKGYVARQERMRQTSWGGVVPKRGLERVGNPMGHGAWEIAARYSALNIDPTAFAKVGTTSTGSPIYLAADRGTATTAGQPQAAREWGLALNWYLNTNLKMAFDYEQTKFKGYGNTFVLPTEKVFAQRMQFVF